MKYKAKRILIWIVVKVERGFITTAKVFYSWNEAVRAEVRWKRGINPDYDEVGIVKSALTLRR